MHIIQIVDLLAKGGAQRLILTFAKEIQKHNLKLSVISLSSDVDSDFVKAFEELGVRVIVFHFRRLLDLMPIVELFRWIKREKPDVIHTHLTYANVIGGLIGFLCKVPVVTTLHTTGTEPRFYGPKTDWAETMALRYVTDYVVACGPSVLNAYNAKLNNRQMQVVPNSISLDKVEFSDDERISLRKHIMGDLDKVLLISIGRLVPPKGFDLLLEALAAVVEKNSNVFLVIVGDGELDIELKNRVKKLNLEKYVSFLGNRDDVSSLLAASDIYVLPSKWEGLPLVILEAMAMGLPIVATDVGDVAWVLDSTGILVPPFESHAIANGILKMLEKKTSWTIMGQKGRQRVEDMFNSTRRVKDILSIYNNLLYEKS